MSPATTPKDRSHRSRIALWCTHKGLLPPMLIQWLRQHWACCTQGSLTWREYGASKTLQYMHVGLPHPEEVQRERVYMGMLFAKKCRDNQTSQQPHVGLPCVKLVRCCCAHVQGFSSQRGWRTSKVQLCTNNAALPRKRVETVGR